MATGVCGMFPVSNFVHLNKVGKRRTRPPLRTLLTLEALLINITIHIPFIEEKRAAM